MDAFQVIDLSHFLDSRPGFEDDCRKICSSLHEFGVVVVKDPRVAFDENDRFLDMMEKYYEQPDEIKEKDVFPKYFYQVGATPEGIEIARDHCAKIEEQFSGQESKQNSPDMPVTQCPPGADPKWRYFWRIGTRPKQTQFESLQAADVIPEAFPQWSTVMNRWGDLMMQCVTSVAEMIAVGFEMDPKVFVDLMDQGPHLLAPTGSDLNKFSRLGTTFASYHYDLNFMTIHGKSRYPGLFVWTRQGKRVQVKVPEGCLLIQAGKQLEYLTGGHVMCGFHEVVVCEGTLEAMRRAKAENRSLWRVSSTLFSHINSDKTLQPLPPFSEANSIEQYPPILAGRQVQHELEQINLSSA